MIAGEVRGAPAVYWRADVLRGGDEHSAQYEERHGVAVMQAINDVVVIARVQFEDAFGRREQTVNHLDQSLSALPLAALHSLIASPMFLRLIIKTALTYVSTCGRTVVRSVILT